MPRDPSEPAPSDDGSPEAEALARYVEARYGDRLDERRREALREEIAAYHEAADAVSAVDLDNADAPAFAFRAIREE